MAETEGECKLSKEQKEFLEECLIEFANRYTDEDEEYKITYERGITTPPIMSPWHGRPRIPANRSGNRNSYQGHRNRDYESRYQRNREERDNYESRHQRNDRREDSYKNKRYQPY